MHALQLSAEEFDICPLGVKDNDIKSKDDCCCKVFQYVCFKNEIFQHCIFNLQIISFSLKGKN